MEASERTADTYIARAGTSTGADWETDRLTFTAEILLNLLLCKKKLESKTIFGAALGCIKTAAQITQILHLTFLATLSQG